jgi:hypothetical protein
MNGLVGSLPPEEQPSLLAMEVSEFQPTKPNKFCTNTCQTFAYTTLDDTPLAQVSGMALRDSLVGEIYPSS